MYLEESEQEIVNSKLFRKYSEKRGETFCCPYGGTKFQEKRC